MKVTNKKRNKLCAQPPIYLMGKGEINYKDISPSTPTIFQTVVSILCFALLMFVLFTI